MNTAKSILESVIDTLKRQDQMPKRIDFSFIGSRYWCVVSDNAMDKLSVINEDVFTGLSDQKEVALLKALSERAERYAFIEGHKNQSPACLTDRSDGFAALPIHFQKENLRANALNEAVERFVWSTWWDNSDIAFNCTELELMNETVQKSEYLKNIFEELKLEYIKVVKPVIENSSFDVQVIIGKIKDKGYISGGACGSIGDCENTFLRGIDEMYRHGFAYNRSIEKTIKPSSLYEDRLMFFASGSGNTLVENRLNQLGVKQIALPDLQIDSPVDSRFDGYQVYRCYFKDQPPFIGGAMERLCL